MAVAQNKMADSARRIAVVSILVALAVLAIKYAAYWVTGSIALYSDAFESIVNVVTAVAALIAIRFSQAPPDDKHPFGHHKAEYFAAVLEGALIIVAAFLILRAAYGAILEPRPLTELSLGLAINAGAAVLNGTWATFLIRRGRDSASPALIADGWHLMTDVVTSLGVLLGLLLAAATGWLILDPLLAALVALNVLWTGARITKTSMSSLLDEAAAPDIVERIRATIQANGYGAMQAHDIRTRGAGRATFIEFHLVVPGAMSVEEAHAICDRLEDAIEAEIAGAEVVIHVEPEHKAKSGGAVEL